MPSLTWPIGAVRGGCGRQMMETGPGSVVWRKSLRSNESMRASMSNAVCVSLITVDALPRLSNFTSAQAEGPDGRKAISTAQIFRVPGRCGLKNLSTGILYNAIHQTSQKNYIKQEICKIHKNSIRKFQGWAIPGNSDREFPVALARATWTVFSLHIPGTYQPNCK